MASGAKGRQSREPLKQRMRGICYRKGVRQQHSTISSFLCHFTMVRLIFPYPGFQTLHYFSSPFNPSPSSIGFAEYGNDLHVRPTWCPSADHPAATLCLEPLILFTCPKDSKCHFWPPHASSSLFKTRSVVLSLGSPFSGTVILFDFNSSYHSRNYIYPPDFQRYLDLCS